MSEKGSDKPIKWELRIEGGPRPHVMLSYSDLRSHRYIRSSDGDVVRVDRFRWGHGADATAIDVTRREVAWSPVPDGEVANAEAAAWFSGIPLPRGAGG